MVAPDRGINAEYEIERKNRVVSWARASRWIAGEIDPKVLVRGSLNGKMDRRLTEARVRGRSVDENARENSAREGAAFRKMVVTRERKGSATLSSSIVVPLQQRSRSATLSFNTTRYLQ